MHRHTHTGTPTHVHVLRNPSRLHVSITAGGVFVLVCVSQWLHIYVCLMGNEHISIVITEQLIPPLQLEVSWVISAAVLNMAEKLTWLRLLFPSTAVSGYTCLKQIFNTFNWMQLTSSSSVKDTRIGLRRTMWRPFSDTKGIYFPIFYPWLFTYETVKENCTMETIYFLICIYPSFKHFGYPFSERYIKVL